MSSNQPPRLSRKRAEALINVAIAGIIHVYPDEDEQDPIQKAEIKTAYEAIAVLSQRYGLGE